MHEKAAALTIDFKIGSADATELEILRCPVQELKPMLQGIAKRARTTAAEGTRKETVELYEIDVQTRTKVYKDLAENEANFLRIVQQAAAWSKESIQKTAHIANTKCDLCGHPKHTIQHVIWSCPALHAARHEANPTLAALQIEVLPPAVQIGIAPALCVYPCKPYWAITNDDINLDLSSGSARYIGISKEIISIKKDGAAFTNRISAAAEATIEMLSERWGDARITLGVLNFTGRKALGHSRQRCFDYDAMIPPRREMGTPPEDINVFPDGGVTAPTQQHLGITAAGIFVPARYAPQAAGDDEIEPAEAQFDQR